MLARQIVIGFGIAMFFPLLVHFGLGAFFPGPKSSDYYTSTSLPLKSPVTEEEKAHAENFRRFNQASAAHINRAVALATGLAIAAILVGWMVNAHAVGAGLVFGGALAIAFGYYTQWQRIDDWVRFLSLLSGLAALVFVGYRQSVALRDREGA